MCMFVGGIKQLIIGDFSVSIAKLGKGGNFTTDALLKICETIREALRLAEEDGTIHPSFQ